MTTPGDYDLTIYVGATFSRRVVWKDGAGALVDLTGYTARMQIRSSVRNPDVLVALTTENSGITLGGTAGTIDLLLTSTQTGAITARAGVYDLELIDSTGVVTRLLQGEVEISPEVTR